jgi:hypothetical protein
MKNEFFDGLRHFYFINQLPPINNVEPVEIVSLAVEDKSIPVERGNAN